MCCETLERILERNTGSGKESISIKCDQGEELGSKKAFGYISKETDFPGGPVVKTSFSNAGGCGFNPWSGS